MSQPSGFRLQRRGLCASGAHLPERCGAPAALALAMPDAEKPRL